MWKKIFTTTDFILKAPTNSNSDFMRAVGNKNFYSLQTDSALEYKKTVETPQWGVLHPKKIPNLHHLHVDTQ